MASRMTSAIDFSGFAFARHLVSLSSVILGMVPIFYPLFGEKDPGVKDFTLGLGVFFLTDRVSALLNSLSESWENQIRLGTILSAVDSRNNERYANVRYVGDKVQAIAEILAKVGHIESIMNTHFVSPGSLTFYSAQELASFRTLFTTVAESHGHVQDIYGGVMATDADAVKAHAGIAGALTSATYKPMRFDVTTPALNFIIISLRSGTTTVYFGWGGHFGDPQGKVYASDDQDLVKLFVNLFKALEHCYAIDHKQLGVIQ